MSLNRPPDYYENIANKISISKRYLSEAAQMSTADAIQFEQFIEKTKVALEAIDAANDEFSKSITK